MMANGAALYFAAMSSAPAVVPPPTVTYTSLPQLSTLPSATERQLASVAGYNGKLYVFGGCNTSYAAYADLFVYDPVAGWSKPSQSGLGAQFGAGGAMIGSVLYTAGHAINSSLGVAATARSVNLTAATLNDADYAGSSNLTVFSAFCTTGSTLFSFGGYNTGVRDTAISWEASDFNSFRSVVLSGVAMSARYGHTAVAIDGAIYLFGGNSAAGVQSNELFKVTVTDATHVTIASKASGPPARYWHAAAALNGKMYVIGGSASGTGLTDLWEYTPATDSWLELDSSPTPLAPGASLVALNGSLYLFQYNGPLIRIDIS